MTRFIILKIVTFVLPNFKSIDIAIAFPQLLIV